MNIEDRYRQIFSEYKPPVDEHSFKRFEQKSRAVKQKNTLLMAAASISIISLLYSLIGNNFSQPTEYANTDLKELKSNIVMLDEKTYENIVTTAPKAIARPLTIKTSSSKKHIKYNTIALSSKKVEAIYYSEFQKNIVGSRITSVQLSIKPQQKNEVPVKEINLKRAIASAKKFVRKTKSKLYIPKVEIDYKSLIAQNQKL